MRRCSPDKKVGENLGRRNIICNGNYERVLECSGRNENFDLAGAEWEVMGRKAAYALYHIIILCLDFLVFPV